MLYNYLKIAIRNLTKNAGYSFINIVGLSIGLTCVILIFLWVADEMSYNTHFANRENIHQVYVRDFNGGDFSAFNSVPLPTYQELKTRDARIKNVCVSDWGGGYLLANGETRVRKQGMFASEEFLQIFQFEFVKGDARTALADASHIVLTESAAKSLFGDAEPMGQTLQVDNGKEYKVAAILRDLPTTCSFDFELLLPWKQLQTTDWIKRNETQWDNYSFQVFVELQPGQNEGPVNAAIQNILTEKGQTDVKREFFLHPLTKWHLYSQFENGQPTGGRIDYVNGFSVLALFILIIACINFMNLATARSERRAREVGIRKSVGSRRSEIIFQFLGESILIAAVSAVIALVLAELALPFYNELTGKALRIEYQSPLFWALACGTVILTGVFAGSYPAFYLSSFQVARVLKGVVQAGKSVTRPRQALVVVQFVIAVGLIVGTIVIAKQIEHVQARQLGYNQKNLISVWLNDETRKNYNALKTDLESSGLAESVAKSNSPITEVFSNNYLDWPGKPVDKKVVFITIATEYDYTKTLGAKVLEGRDFSPDFPSDSSAILVNQAAAEIMNLQETVGTEVTLWDSKRTIVGVIDNVVMRSPYEEPKPMFVIFNTGWASSITIRIKDSNDMKAVMAGVEAVFKKHAPTNPFEFEFVDEQFAKKYRSIQLIGNLANLFSALAIVITGLGLLGLAAFTAEQRTKEIGIRKVMGASVSGIVLLISKEFTWLVLIAFAIAAPLSWWGFNKFLMSYDYRIEFPLWALALAGCTALAFALFIVGTQAWKAATANPVKSLRSE